MLLLSILINKKDCNFLLSKNVHYMRIFIFFLNFQKILFTLVFQSQIVKYFIHCIGCIFLILGTKDVIKTRLTSIHTEKFTTAVIETDFVSKDVLWLVSIVKLLGYTLGISLLIILGLVCLFLCKRRRELKALNISQPIERDFRLLNYFSNRNVDRVASNINSRNNINISEVSQGHFEISRVGRTDDRSRKKFVGKSRNAYVDQVSQETGRHSPVELPAYLEVLP